MLLTIDSFLRLFGFEMPADTRNSKKGGDSHSIDELLKGIEALEATVVSQGKKIEKLEAEKEVKDHAIDAMKKSVKQSADRSEELEQYGRRNCLRIHGVEVADNETSDDVVKKVESIAAEVGVTLQRDDIFRAHCIGKVVEKKGKKTKQIIVKFRSWNARCGLYKSRPTVKKPVHTAKSFSSISVDLTKKRLSLLHKAREVIEEKYGKESEVFAYADINCRLHCDLMVKISRFSIQ